VVPRSRSPHDTLRPVNVLVLVGIAAVAFVAALVAFDRRDLTA
jgi:ABC-type transport system involved in multi-copper enzyme maturation permease subunit